MSGLDSLKVLHDAVIDAISGYDKAIESADAGYVQPIFQEAKTLHRKAHVELDALLQSKGEMPDESGTFMSTVHKAVISIRAATTGLDLSSLNSFADGEERILTAYDDAISQNRAEKGIVDLLVGQRDQLRLMITRMREASHRSDESA